MSKYVMWTMALNFLYVIVILFGLLHISEVSNPEGNEFLWGTIIVVLSLLTLFLGRKIQVLFHELGHLVGGLLTGYKFVSFTVSKKTLIRENGKLTWRNYSYGGVGGRVLLLPPELKDGKAPYKLMFSGGILTDLIFSIVYFLLFLTLADNILWLACICLVMAANSLHSVFLNGLPFNNGGVLTDGYVLTELGRTKDKTVLPIFMLNLRAEALRQTGVRTRDLPTSLFEPLTVSNLTNSIYHVALSVQKAGYLLDNKQFNEAKEILKEIFLNISTYEEIKLPVQVTLLFTELITDKNQEVIEQLYNDELKEYLQIISTHEDKKISVFQIWYSYARLVEKDDTKAQEYLALFEEACQQSVNFGSLPLARDMMALVDELAS